MRPWPWVYGEQPYNCHLKTKMGRYRFFAEHDIYKKLLTPREGRYFFSLVPLAFFKGGY